MPSLIAWLDYSEDQRRRMREVIDLFRERDTLDELGVGSIRDTFGELLFPGLSTIQTRARYFLFIPWVYLRLEAERVPSDKADQRARHLQTQLIGALERGGADSGDGVIGWDAREKLSRLPSTVYWGGLGSFGIRRFSGSVADYHRGLDDFYRRLSNHAHGEGNDLYQRVPTNWNPALPPPPSDLWEATSMELRAEEAAFLRDRILIAHPRTFLAYLAINDDPHLADTRFPWTLNSVSDVEEPTRTWLHHARLFSIVMQGAAWVYNLLLAQLAVRRGMGGNYSELADKYRAALESWAVDITALGSEITEWNIDQFWRIVREANPRVPPTTQAFVTTWIQAARRDPYRVATVPDDIHRLIEQREVHLKRSQARLRNQRALELWSGAAGTRQLDYRWPTVQRILTDLHEGFQHA